MELRRLGRHQVKVSALGLGLAALGRPGYITLGHAVDLGGNYETAVMEQHAHHVLDAAWAAGVCYVDVARSYGRAEAFVASWLQSRQIEPGMITVGSKWGYTYTANWQVQAAKHEVKEHSLPVLQRQLGESRHLLGAYLDLYQIHSATLDSGVLANRAVLTELAGLKREGLLIGLSLSGDNQAAVLERALEVRLDGVLLFDAVQATWNILEQAAGAALKAAHEAGLGVIIKEAVANGRLTPRNQQPTFAPKRRIMESLAAAYETTIDALALAFVLAQPWVDVVLSGAATVDHLQSNIAAARLVLRRETLEQLQALVEPPADYWQIRSHLAWN